MLTARPEVVGNQSVEHHLALRCCPSLPGDESWMSGSGNGIVHPHMNCRRRRRHLKGTKQNLEWKMQHLRIALWARGESRSALILLLKSDLQIKQ